MMVRARVAAAALCVTWVVSGTVPAMGFEVTEPDRPRCANYDEYRQPFFGTTHLHTGLSFDSSIRFVETTPRGAYRFAKGEQSLTLPNLFGLQQKVVSIDTPTDWGAVTDHSEQFGEIGICQGFLPDTPSRPMGRGRLASTADVDLMYSLDCQMMNAFYWRPEVGPSPYLQRTSSSSAMQIFALPADSPVSFNTHLPVCVNNPDQCDAAELAVWEEMQGAAQDEYDQTDACQFTTFVAYEAASSPGGQNWHRNVIFRNDRVVKKPITSIVMAIRQNPNPQLEPPRYFGHPEPVKLWNALQEDCLDGGNVTDGTGTRCDVLTIPHNPNLGGGEGLIPPLFYDPPNTSQAEKRAYFEPLVEIFQDKGSSECRYDPRFGYGVETSDELCDFELLDTLSITDASGIGSGSSSAAPAPDQFNPRAFVRNVLKDGMAVADQYGGTNPFKLGIVASSDSHNGTMGWHPEDASFFGHLGIEDVTPARAASTIQNSSGGHSVVWAEENSRDSIFEALKRKETYGTSGTRPVVRFFGGWNFADDLCGRNFVKKGYKQGVPMGGDLPAMPTGAAGPRFIAAAWMDDTGAGSKLEQVQIIKGWVDAQGQTQEKVVSVAGIPGDPTEYGVDQDCVQQPPYGSDQLCAVWEDPEFDPNVPAFYYVRVLERPVCRYSTYICQQLDLNPFDLKDCNLKLRAFHTAGLPQASLGGACCSDETTYPIVQPVIQERAWTSPIWYTPVS